MSISTSSVHQAQAYDYWRSIAFTDFCADAPSKQIEHRFQASAKGVTCEAADFFVTQSDQVSGRRLMKHIDHDGLDSISLGFILQGTRRARSQDGIEAVASAGDLFVYDARVPSEVSLTRHKAIYLVIRRTELREVLGPDIPPVAILKQRLQTSPLMPVLRENLGLLSRNHETLTGGERNVLIDQARQISRQAFIDRTVSSVTKEGDPLIFVAALRHIERNYADVNLDVDSLCHALKCSRSTLYRAFAARDLKVAETILAVRLDRAKQLIEQCDPSMTITSIAEQCGLFDTANFSRQFKRRFGMTPTERRHEVSII
ncbi:helix-turn-helix transcriptional regulator [Rhizobium sp. AQ_MP]|uniref:helix-turn-helix domain-containing protein n=1 Tax=Rhizobium sp. AQ_MP TaxID=2761536 RepID=UPI00163AF1BC|nr:helix-turn-helix transcriptional regulator [Rhizobium sp. AQ_MP]